MGDSKDARGEEVSVAFKPRLACSVSLGKPLAPQLVLCFSSCKMGAVAHGFVACKLLTRGSVSYGDLKGGLFDSKISYLMSLVLARDKVAAPPSTVCKAYVRAPGEEGGEPSFGKGTK